MTADKNRGRSVAFYLRICAALLGLASAALWIYGAMNAVTPAVSFPRWGMAVAFLALALYSRWPMRWPSPSAGWAAALVGVFTILRVVDLEHSPFQLTVDEIQYPFFAIEADIYAQPARILSGLTGGYATFVSLFVQSWPCTFLSPAVCGRAASVVLGAVALWFTYALGARLVGRVAGLTALVVVGCSFWHWHYSRVAYPCMQPMAIVPLALYVAVCGVEERNAFLKFLAGILLGLCLLLYTPSRVAVPVFIVWYLYCVAVRRERARDVFATIVSVGLGLFFILAPSLLEYGIAVVLLRYNETVFAASAPLARMREAGFTSGAALQIAGAQLYEASRIFVTSGATLSPHTWAPVPLIDPVSLALVLVGVILAIAKFRETRLVLLLTLIAVTFVSGQLATDIPNSAYRAAPMLPALAILAGFTVQGLVQLFDRPGRQWSRWAFIGILACLMAAALPLNLAGLRQYYVTLSTDSIGSVGRMVAASTPDATYYFIGQNPIAREQVLEYLSHPRKLRDIPSLMDALGTELGDGGNVVFVINPGMSSPEFAIRRCYPSAEPLAGPSLNGGDVVRALQVSAFAIAQGRGCAPATAGPGLLAKYFRDKDWRGDVIVERIEDWPVRWFTEEDLSRFGSVEWSGSLRVPKPGQYRFALSTGAAEGTFELNGGGELSANQEQIVALEKGFPRLRIRCRPTGAGSTCFLRWMPPGGSMRLIPLESLSPES